MQQEEYQDRHIKYIRINKRKARIKYNEHKTIFLIQDMMRLPNAWETPYSINKLDDYAFTMERDFDKRVNEFKHYHYNSERGHGVKYFIKQEDLTNNEIIQAALDLGPLANMYVIEALRCGLLTYMKEFTDKEINKVWAGYDSPDGVRAKMSRIYEVITQK